MYNILTKYAKKDGGFVMDENKEALKKDLRLVLQINAKLDYANQEEVKKVYAAITEKNIVSTSVGKKYAYKLKQIINGNEKYSCMFCNTVITEKSLVCKTCLNRLLAKRVENETNKVETITQNLTQSICIYYDKSRED